MASPPVRWQSRVGQSSMTGSALGHVGAAIELFNRGITHVDQREPTHSVCAIGSVKVRVTVTPPSAVNHDQAEALDINAVGGNG